MAVYIRKKSRWITYNLSSDKDVDFYFRDWPITWSGLINSKQVTIIQSQYSDNSNDYKFSIGVTDDEKAKLISAIDTELKVLLD